jgi:hypothetical protein
MAYTGFLFLAKVIGTPKNLKIWQKWAKSDRLIGLTNTEELAP